MAGLGDDVGIDVSSFGFPVYYPASADVGLTNANAPVDYSSFDNPWGYQPTSPAQPQQAAPVSSGSPAWDNIANAASKVLATAANWSIQTQQIDAQRDIAQAAAQQRTQQMAYQYRYPQSGMLAPGANSLFASSGGGVPASTLLAGAAVLGLLIFAVAS